jgi:N-acetylglucosamine-6-phosphate deacetylase
MTVLVEQDKIVAIDPWTKVKAPAGSQIVDGRGKFLIPGLWDMHVHGFSPEPGSDLGANGTPVLPSLTTQEPVQWIAQISTLTLTSPHRLSTEWLQCAASGVEELVVHPQG